MKKKLPLYAFIASALLLTGCLDFDFCDSCGDGGKDNFPIGYVVAFNPNDDSSTTSIVPDLTATWVLMNANTLPDWLSVSPHDGEAGYEVQISVTKANTTDKPLIHILTFVSFNGEKQIIKVIHEELDTSWYSNRGRHFSIGTRNELAGLAYLVNKGTDNFRRKTISLKNSIDLSPWNTGKGWIPIGSANNRSFVGTFDGRGHTITSLVINYDDFDYTGLFGYVYEGMIKNTGLVDVEIVGSGNTGGIAGYVWRGGIANCSVTGMIKGGGMVGGIAGFVNGNVANCNTIGVVNGRMFVGGIVGWAGGDITDCYTIGTVDGGSHVGGLAGSITLGSATLCYAEGTIKGNDVVGGIAGTIHNSKIANCSVLNATVTGLTNFGRLVGTKTGTNVLDNNED
ncbi:MAG: hypothetical protein FWD56_02985 [Bacteroidales bacterium]|nr:hypothetical protein [Bacteroidales bacterium]